MVDFDHVWIILFNMNLYAGYNIFGALVWTLWLTIVSTLKEDTAYAETEGFY